MLGVAACELLGTAMEAREEEPSVTCSVNSSLRAFLDAQMQRVHTYSLFERAFLEYEGDSNELKFQARCTDITEAFKQCSFKVNEVEAMLRGKDLGRHDLADVIRNIQAHEKQKLHLTIILQVLRKAGPPSQRREMISQAHHHMQPHACALSSSPPLSPLSRQGRPSSPNEESRSAVSEVSKGLHGIHIDSSDSLKNLKNQWENETGAIDMSTGLKILEGHSGRGGEFGGRGGDRDEGSGCGMHLDSESGGGRADSFESLEKMEEEYNNALMETKRELSREMAHINELLEEVQCEFADSME